MTSPIVPPDPALAVLPPSTTPDETSEEGRDDVTAVEPDVDDARPTTRRRRWRWGLALGVLVVAALVAAAFLVQLPYYLIQPGSVRPAEQRVEVIGAESYETDGEVLFTTVFISRATPALMVRAWLDDAIETRTEAEMYPDGDREGSQRENRQRMDLSKLVATRVALEHLGIDAAFDGEGARVLGVLESSPSDGLIRTDDVIVGVDGGEVGMPSDIGVELEDREPGDTVEVELRRGGSGDPQEFDLVLGESESKPSRPVLGVEVEPANPSIASTVDVTVDSGDVSGPSAGLAWTLAIIDRLTPGSLTDGRRVAVTGEILDDGTVGPIGGVVQKVAAVKRAGIELFLYPAATPEAEQEKMREVAGDDVELRPVADVDEAMAVLVPGGVELPRQGG